MLLGTDAIIYVRYSGSNTLYFSDAASDLENNGLSNQHNLSITQADTDHDGINDGAEFNYWNITRRLPLSTAIEYCKNPDVDGDNITDGKEIYGYEVKIIVDWKSDGTPISRMRFISPDELDPLTPYTNASGVYLDTDRDGIPDVVEVYLANHSKWSTFKANYPVLWQKYSWISDYYNTIVSKENESAANEWLKSQFNPLIVDHTPPVITKFTIKWEVKYSLNWTPVQVYARVHLIVRDIGGITSLKIVDKDSGESVSLEHYGKTSYEMEHNFSASLWQAGFGSVHIKVEAKDYAGNKIKVDRELKGALGQVLDALAKIWNRIWNTLQSAAEAVMSGVQWIIEWIIAQFENIFNKFISLVMIMLMGIVNSYAAYLTSVIYEVGNNRMYNVNTISSKYEFSNFAERKFRETMLSLEYALFGVIMVIVGLIIAIKAMSMGIEELVEIAIVKTAEEMLLTTFLGVISKEMFKDIGNILQYTANDSMVINKTLDYLHLSISGVLTIINIAETFLEFFTKGSRFKFMAGFTLALTGYMLDVVTKAMGLNGTALMYADIMGIVISLFGVLIMVYYKNRATEELAIENSAPLVSLLEWVIAIVGVLKAITDIASDYSSNWEG